MLKLISSFNSYLIIFIIDFMFDKEINQQNYDISLIDN